MSEYELIDVLYNIFGSMNESASIYFTLVSAYLVVSFFIGSQLTRPQLLIVNTLYIFWVIGVINSGFAGLNNALVIMAQLREMDSQVVGQGAMVTSAAVYGFMLIQFMGLAASLYFMWSVRHSKPA